LQYGSIKSFESISHLFFFSKGSLNDVKENHEENLTLKGKTAQRHEGQTLICESEIFRPSFVEFWQ